MSHVPTNQALRQAMQHHREGRLALAEAIYRQILQAQPENFDAVQLLGVIALQTGNHTAAIAMLRKALHLDPQATPVRINLARAMHAAGEFNESIRECDAALSRNGNLSDAHVLRAASLVASGRAVEAIDSWQRAIALEPARADTHAFLGATLEMLGRLDEALAACSRAVELDPSFALGRVNHGSVLAKLGRLNEAIAEHLRAIELSPDFANAYVNLAFVAQQLGNLDQAEAAARKAVELAPNDPGAHRNLAAALEEKGELHDAARSFADTVRLLESRGAHGDRSSADRLRVVAATLLPAVYASAGEIEQSRRRLTEELEAITREGVGIRLDDDPAPTLFALVYQGRDDRDINQQFARLMIAPALPAPIRHGGGRIRIGFVSRFLREHTIGRLNQGLIAGLSRDAFDVTVFNVHDVHDTVADYLRAHTEHCLTLPSRLSEARELIVEQQLDVVFYTDLGMDPFTYSLAFSRLAPVQCAGWGHPVTSAIDTIDYFISSEALEPVGADAHYTEKLVRQKTPAVCYRRPPLASPRKTRGDFGLSNYLKTSVSADIHP